MHTAIARGQVVYMQSRYSPFGM